MAIPTAKYAVTIGFNVEIEGKQVTLKGNVTKPLINSLRTTLADNFGGCTIVRTLGAWIDKKGSLVSEPGITAYVLCDHDTEANYALFKSIANEYRVLFNQQSVVIERQPLTYEFI